MLDNHEKIYAAILTVAKQLEPLYGTDEYVDGVITFSLGNAIFGAPNIFIQKCTPSCKYAKKPGPGRDTTWEHIWGRKNSAITIIQQIRKGKSDAFLIRLIKSRCRVTITLKSENQALRPYQNDEVLAKKHPRQAYKAAGLDWVDWVGDKVYNIEGTVYNSREEIMLYHEVTPQQLTYRLSKASKKWKEWKIERVS
jgi:hypothetical protein